MIDLDTGVIVAAPIHPSDVGDTATLGPTLEEAHKNLSAAGLARHQKSAIVNGLSFTRGLQELDGGVWKTRIAGRSPPTAICAGMEYAARMPFTPTARG
jgi:hypothetical protein